MNQPHEPILTFVNQNPDCTPYDRVLTRLTLDPILSKGSRRLIVLLMAYYRKIKVKFPFIFELLMDQVTPKATLESVYLNRRPKDGFNVKPDGDFVFSFLKSELMD